MADLAIQTTTRAGVQPTQNVASAGGDAFVNTGRELIHVINGAGALVLTIETPATVDGLAVAERTVSIGANENHIIGPFPTATYNDVDNKVQLTYDDEAAVTVDVFLPGA